ncbi:hypothetical protein K458DRAFT_378898 [Lentithecium fluviatile CBS 122367]|uniref:RING-type domain-containing protein n=1 Tax=Lentithecium fluviatile CBS 122367 TaxID=1168545 RepID=A0A6G1IGB6_9PLEO|nr:hypothetical protein K458DRAFT_378898 [Lentithecium fluviatile CBS 122367]
MPIQNEQTHGWSRFKSLIQAISLRRTKASIGGDLQLPPKEEILQTVQLDHSEIKIYDMLKRAFVLRIGSGAAPESLFETILRLRQVCDHGADLLPAATQKWIGRALKGAKTLLTEIPELRTCEVCEETVQTNSVNASGISADLLPCLHSICDICLTQASETERPDETRCPICSDCATPSLGIDWHKNPQVVCRPSSKVKALLKNLRESQRDAIDGPIKR